MPAPLAGLRVLDLSRLLPGPYCTLVLADLGAEVIKIETPRVGDYLRHAPAQLGFAGMFEILNRHKQSLALNYRNARGKEVFLQLAQKADVIVETFRPGAMARWGIGYEAVRALNPNIIYCSLSGYGQSGPASDLAGHDLNYLALGGFLDFNGPAGGPPVIPGVPVADLAGGLLAALSILAAAVGRERGQGGRYLDVAMLDAVMSWMLPIAGSFLFSQGAIPARGRLPLGGGLPSYHVYQTADDEWVTFAALEPNLWADFCAAVKRPDLNGRQFDPAAIADMAALFREKTRADWQAVFQGKDICVEPVNTFAEAWRDPQVLYRGLARPGVDPLSAIGPLFQFAAPEHASPAPAQGQHTRAVLRQIGLTEAEIQKLETDGVAKSAG
jgi:crotonobetainyl-CoA:carnitine CoA-transferase CaiB-like acyl-CoA transferase